MSLPEEFAAARAMLTGPTDAELIETARWMVEHPDTSSSIKPILAALLNEISRLKARCRVLSGRRVVSIKDAFLALNR